MTRKKEPTPEERAEWAEVKRLLRERIALREAEQREFLEREACRRGRLRRLSLGLLGRG
ncbi:MAG: hypothetical protein KJ051_00125 [Thermoleophilia bacterium]|nr:hypothetical protein [Thermoleophilia bacterium]